MFPKFSNKNYTIKIATYIYKNSKLIKSSVEMYMYVVAGGNRKHDPALVYPLIPKSGQSLISCHNTNALPSRQVMRMN